MHNFTLYSGRKHFLRYFLPAFSTEEILNCHINDCFKINGKQMIIVTKGGEYVELKNFERKTKSLFMIYADFFIHIIFFFFKLFLNKFTNQL